MRTADVDIIMISEQAVIDPGHWMARWQTRMSTARLLAIPAAASGTAPKMASWIDALVGAVAIATRPVVVMAHGLGVAILVESAPRFDPAMVKGAFLVAPLGEGALAERYEHELTLSHLPRIKLPFPSVTIASRNDPFCPVLDAEEWAFAWGSEFVDAGDAGHLDPDAGYGPWPEGLMRFAGFMGKL